MKPDEKILLFLVFATGVMAGAALQILVFAPAYESDEVGERPQLSIVGEVYGGCAMSTAGCDTFRYVDDRSYQYLRGETKKEGTISTTLARALGQHLTQAELSALSAPAETTDCQSFVDGVDYRYEITINRERYRLDTCQTALSYDSELQKIFIAMWREMAAGEGQYPSIVEKGLGGWIAEQLGTER